jgi:hypothetical protein
MKYFLPMSRLARISLLAVIVFVVLAVISRFLPPVMK